MGSRNYVNSKSMYNELVLFYEARKAKKDPPISRYIGECITLICNKMGTRMNFAGYSYIDEMIADGILHCVAAVPKYNPTRNDNPFGYFSRVAWRAFLQRIAEEKDQNVIKHLNYQHMHLFDEIDTGDVSDNELSNKVISDHEAKLAKDKLKKEQKKNDK